MKVPLASSLVLLFMAAAPSLAQDPDPLSKLDPTSRYKIQVLVDSASILGLPTRPLLSNAYLGVSRHADGRTIVRSLGQLLHAMSEAKTVLGPKASDADVVSGASVIQAGVPAERLSQFRSGGRTERPLTTALTVLGDLITRGVPMDEASSTIAELWQHGAGDNDFFGLWKSVEDDILQGQSPGAALQQRAREFPGRTPATKVPPPSAKPPENPSSQ